jgi:hypothetical protein
MVGSTSARLASNAAVTSIDRRLSGVEATAGGWAVSADLRNVVRFALFICWEGESEGIKIGRKPSRVFEGDSLAFLSKDVWPQDVCTLTDFVSVFARLSPAKAIYFSKKIAYFEENIHLRQMLAKWESRADSKLISTLF